MPSFTVARSIQINAPVDKVYASVRKLREWPRWSPWIIAEPDATMTYAADGTAYSWEGKIVGSGELAITGEAAGRVIDYRLSFFKPWKSVNVSQFAFAAKDGGTEVTWSMTGALPWLFFWMTGMMSAFVGMDFQRGLAMLKDLLERGEVPSHLRFANSKAVAGCRYIGVRSTCAIPEIGAAMEKSFGSLMAALGKAGIEASGPPISIYHKWRMVKGLAEFTAAVPVAEIPSGLPSDLVTGELPACRAYTVEHTGPYRHLGNAWAAGEMRARAKPRLFHRNRKIDPFESYENDPAHVPEHELVTVVHFPEK